MSDELLDWGQVDVNGAGGGNRNDIDFMRLQESNQIRLVGRPKQILRYYLPANEGKTQSVIVSADNDPVANKQPNLKRKERYAILIFDRKDGNKLKVMEAPSSVFSPFKSFYSENNIEPGGQESYDFSITKTGSGMNTRYSVQNLIAKTPFTEEELATIHEKKQSGYDLTRLFKPTGEEKVAEILNGVVIEEDAGVSDNKAASAGASESSSLKRAGLDF